MKFHFAVIFILSFACFAFGQISDEIDPAKRIIPYDEVNAAFLLNTASPPSELGFDNPKAVWKFSYELRFLKADRLAFDLQNKIYAKYRNQDAREKWLPKANKDLDKALKKASLPVGKGKVKKLMLESEDNRQVIIPIKLSPEIQEAIADSAANGSNPQFRIFVKGKVSTKTATNLKLKQKYAKTFACPVKAQVLQGKSYWLLNRCGVSVEIKNENGKIHFGMFSRL